MFVVVKDGVDGEIGPAGMPPMEVIGEPVNDEKEFEKEKVVEELWESTDANSNAKPFKAVAVNEKLPEPVNPVRSAGGFR